MVTLLSYSHGLIAASLTMSMISSYTAFCFAERITLSDGTRKSWWLASGSLVMGFGIWSMHYLGMLAIHESMASVYSLPIVILSLLFAVFASAGALHFTSKAQMSTLDILAGSALLGGGVSLMHYTGMAAMRSCSVQRYSIGMVVASIFIALLFAWISLSITFRVRSYGSDGERYRIGGALIMGCGIAAMHYTAMAAVTFVPVPGAKMVMSSRTLEIRALSGIGVAATTLLILGGALLIALLDRVTYRSLREAHLRLLDAHTQLAHAQETLLHREKSLREANSQLREISIRDGLTNLYNRRYLDEVLQTEWRQAKRTCSPISMLMIDVDCFKGFNDEYGHPAGDRTLQQLAAELQQAMQRSNSFAARYGGEEFAIVAALSVEQAEELAEEVRKAIFGLRIPNCRNLRHQAVSVSIGVCGLVPGTGDTLEALMQQADHALYRAKAMGKNCSEVWSWDRRSNIEMADEESSQNTLSPLPTSGPLSADRASSRAGP